MGNDGWGIQLHRGEVVNNIVARNRSGGIYVLFDVFIINNTIVNNEVGGGISLDSGEPYTIVNNIIWDNAPDELPI
jgi:hypothetical protein